MELQSCAVESLAVLSLVSLEMSSFIEWRITGILGTGSLSQMKRKPILCSGGML